MVAATVRIEFLGATEKVMDAVRHWQTYLKLDPSSAWGAIARRELGKLKKSAVVDGKNGSPAEDRKQS